MYEIIKEELVEDSKKEIESMKEGINSNENLLRHYSTEKRWSQYQSGEITEKQAKDYACTRMEKQKNKEFEKKISMLDKISDAKIPEFVEIMVEWSKGNQAKATVTVDGKIYRGSFTHGYGFDKRSSAISPVLNNCDGIRKALCDYKEAQLEKGGVDTSETSVTGRCNHEIIDYGAGYNIIPSFEGGVGIRPILDIFKELGYEVTENEFNEHVDYYTMRKKAIA